MITINAINEANLAITEAIEKWLSLPCPHCAQLFTPEAVEAGDSMRHISEHRRMRYQPEELVARGQVLPTAEGV